jgi:TatD DNase family protein
MSAKKKKKIEFPLLPEGVCLTDSHCHLDMEEYRGEVADLLDRAAGLGVGRVMSIGIDLASSRAAAAIAAAEKGVAAAAGVHPHYVAGFDARGLDELAAVAAAGEVRAIGEIGMDLCKSRVPAQVQARAFELQLGLARDLGLPVVIHDRDAHDQVFDILERFAPFERGGVMHCFSGDLDLAMRAVDLGFMVSIPGVVTFPNAGAMRRVAAEAPLSSLLVETDGPYLSPVPLRGRRNEPANVLFTAAEVARLRGIPLAELARVTTANAIEVFGLEDDDERGR